MASEGIAWFAASLAHGVVLSFLFTPLHETIHGTAFRARWLNAVVAEAFGFLLLLPPRYFRFFHFAHHRHTQDAARDPELSKPRPANAWQYAWYLTGLPYWGGQIAAIFRSAWGAPPRSFVPLSAQTRVATEARLHLAGYGLVAGLSIILGARRGHLAVAYPRAPGATISARLSSGRARSLPAGRRHAHQHPHDLHQRRRSLPRLEHAPPYRSPRPPDGAVPPASAADVAARPAAALPRRRIHRSPSANQARLAGAVMSFFGRLESDCEARRKEGHCAHHAQIDECNGRRLP